MVSPSRSRVDEVYRALSSAILNGEHEPGSRLHSASLRTKYGVSTGVLREVLTRLTGAGFTVSEPQRGFRVVPVSEADLRHLTESRVLIESVLVRQAVEHGDLAFEAALTAALHTLTRTPVTDGDGRVRPEWLATHRDFHHALLAGAPNTRLLGIAATLRDAAEIYRCWSRTVAGDTARDVDGEHRALTEAVLGRDAERAVTLLTRHIEHGTEVLLGHRAADRAPASRGEA